MERLINTLLFLGYKPFKENYVKCIVEDKYNYRFYKDILNSNHYDCYSINDICSIDSGLFQFIVDFKLYSHQKYNNPDVYLHFNIPNQGGVFKYNNYEYWILLVSIQKDKAQFILDNTLTI